MPSKSDNAEVSKASPKDKIKQVQVLERARRILRTLADCPAPVSLHEISEMTEIHMSTVHRLLWNLCQDGLVDRMNNGRWRLGLTFLEYGSLVRDRLDIREKAIGVMQLLFERTGQTINLAIRRNDSIMYIEHVYAPGTGVRLARRIGAMAPLHCTSGGKLFLSDMPPEEVSAYISRTDWRRARSTRSAHPKSSSWKSTASKSSAGPTTRKNWKRAFAASALRFATRPAALWPPSPSLRASKCATSPTGYGIF